MVWYNQLYNILCESSGDLSVNGSRNGYENGSSGDGYLNTPYAWTAPETFETEGATFTHYASPYNSNDIGIAPYHRNSQDSVKEVNKQLPPSFTYEGPIAGAGFLGLFPPKQGSPQWNAYVNKPQKVKEKYNQRNVGIFGLPKNTYSRTRETIKQTKGPNLWESLGCRIVQHGDYSLYDPDEPGIIPKSSIIHTDLETKETGWWENFVRGLKEGYNEAPEDVNVFQESLDNAGNALTGIIKPPNYSLLLIGGAVLLFIMIIRR